MILTKTNKKSLYFIRNNRTKKQILQSTFVAATLLSLLGAMLYGVFVPTNEAKAAIGPAVFFLNHQDDEMWLAGAIREHINAGRETHVVMATTGDGSNSRNKINGKDDAGKPVYCYIHYKYHNPEKEGFNKLTVRDFAVARNIEFVESMKDLGVPAENIHFANQDVNPNVLPGESYKTAWQYPKFDDTKMTIDQANEIVNFYFNKFGEGGYKTIATGAGAPMSDYVHNDHRQMYLALWNNQKISDKRFYTNIAYGEKKALTSAVIKSKKTALSNYTSWNPGSARYATGYHSVGKLLDTWMTNGVEYIIKDKTAPAVPSNFALTEISYKDQWVKFSWVNPYVSDFSGVVVVKKKYRPSTSITDGTIVYKGNASQYTEKFGESGYGRYYYTIFSFDTAGNYSKGVSYLRPIAIYPSTRYVR